MPPKKRARLSPAPSTPNAALSPTPSKLDPETSSTHASSALDAWTTDQEIALLKLLINHKPTGPHKHMHMLSIYTSLKTEGHTHIPGRGRPIEREHMRIPNLWAKLRSMYDLDALDDRENAALEEAEEAQREEQVEAARREHPPEKKRGGGGRKKSAADEDAEDEVPNPAVWRDFDPSDRLEGLREEMFLRGRLASQDPPSSPSAIETRGGRESVGSGSRVPLGRTRSARVGSMRQSAAEGRRGSRATTATGDDLEMKDEVNGEGDEEDADEEDGDEDEEAVEDDDEEDEAQETTSTRSGRAGRRGATGSARRGRRKR